MVFLQFETGSLLSRLRGLENGAMAFRPQQRLLNGQGRQALQCVFFRTGEVVSPKAFPSRFLDRGPFAPHIGQRPEQGGIESGADSPSIKVRRIMRRSGNVAK
jgi:hypothetical protein